jgi:hypothetical protein
MARQNAGLLGFFLSSVPSGFLWIALLALCSCGSATPPAPAPSVTSCTLGMQARVQYSTQPTIGAGTVVTAGTLTTTNGSSNCNGSATTFSGITNPLGIDNHTEVRFNAYWDVTWDWLQTAYSNCGLQGAGPVLVPDSGQTFVDTCTL